MEFLSGSSTTAAAGIYFMLMDSSPSPAGHFASFPWPLSSESDPRDAEDDLLDFAAPAEPGSSMVHGSKNTTEARGGHADEY